MESDHTFIIKNEIKNESTENLPKNYNEYPNLDLNKQLRRKREKSSSEMQNNTKLDESIDFDINLYESKSNRYPWMKRSVGLNGPIKLHYELYEYYKYIKPGKKENELFKETYYTMKDIIKRNWPSWKVRLFGSFSTDLHLIDSDIDIIVLKTEQNSNKEELPLDDSLQDYEQLIKIYDYLYETRRFKSIIFIDAKVPIIKVILRNGMKVDISYYILN